MIASPIIVVLLTIYIYIYIYIYMYMRGSSISWGSRLKKRRSLVQIPSPPLVWTSLKYIYIYILFFSILTTSFSIQTPMNYLSHNRPVIENRVPTGNR
jgi:hypothetical protein